MIPQQVPQGQPGAGQVGQQMPFQMQQMMQPPQPAQTAPTPKFDGVELQQYLDGVSDGQLKQLAQDPKYMTNAMYGPMINAELTRRVAARQQAQAQQGPQGPQPTVVQQAQQAAMQLPEDTGIAQLPAENIAHMADGGIVALAGGGDYADYDYAPDEEEDATDVGAPLNESTVSSIFERERLSPAQRRVANSILMQESGYGRDQRTSVSGAIGPGQVMPDTFKRFAKPGERIDNPEDNLAVAARYIRYLGGMAGDDPARIATGYFSGEGNIGTDTPWKRDTSDPTGKKTSAYVRDVTGRLADNLDVQAQPTAVATAPELYFGRRVALPESLRSADIPSDVSGLDKLLNKVEKDAEDAESKVRSFSLRKRKLDPSGFESARLDLERAQAEKSYLMGAYQDALRKEQPHIFGNAPTNFGYTPTETVQIPNMPARLLTSREKARPDVESELAGTVMPEYAEYTQPQERERRREERMPPDLKREVLAEAKKAVPASERKGMSDEALMTFFLQLMGGRSRNFLRNVSGAGLAALETERGLRKEEGERRKEEALAKYYEQIGASYSRDPEMVRTWKALGNGNIQLGAQRYSRIMQERSPASSEAAIRDKAADNLAARLKGNMVEQMRASKDPTYYQKLFEEELNRLRPAGAAGAGGSIKFLGFE